MGKNEKTIRNLRCRIAVSDAFQFLGLEEVARITSCQNEQAFCNLIGKLAARCPQTAEEAVAIIWDDLIPMFLCPAPGQDVAVDAPPSPLLLRRRILRLCSPFTSDR